MKIKCIKAYKDSSNGILGIGRRDRQPIKGLTQGKIYDTQVVTSVEGSGNSISFNNYHYFLIFNDNKEWETYDLNLFEPI